jgi:hypothetical protein
MTEVEAYPYTTHLDIKFPALAVVDVPALVAACRDRWYNQTLCKVNDSVIRLGVMQGEYHWHKHDNDDEFFFVLDGHFIIDLEDRSVDLQRLEGRATPHARAGSRRDSDGGDFRHRADRRWLRHSVPSGLSAARRTAARGTGSTARCRGCRSRWQCRSGR